MGKKEENTYFQDWYSKNREKFLERRRARYQEDKSYRERQQQYTRDSRQRKKDGEELIYQNTLADLANTLNICTGTIRYWFKQGYMPVPPKGASGRYSITDESLSMIKEAFDEIGGRLKPSNVKQFKEITTTLIESGWHYEGEA